MPPTDPFQQHSVKALFHFTDVENVPFIRKHGGLYSRLELQKRKIVVPKPGGNDWSKDADARIGGDRYVHLCLRNSHPMEYQAKKAGHIGETLFLEIDPEVRNLPGVMYSHGVSNKAGISLISMKEALAQIDFPVLYTRTDWNDPAIKERLKLASKCEILIPDHVALKYIRNLPNG